jgi:hypothetical protein
MFFDSAKGQVDGLVALGNMEAFLQDPNLGDLTLESRNRLRAITGTRWPFYSQALLSPQPPRSKFLATLGQNRHLLEWSSAPTDQFAVYLSMAALSPDTKKA